MTLSESFDGDFFCPPQGRASTNTMENSTEFHRPVKVKCMRQVFSILGTEWNEIGKADTDLNLMLSSPLFRHQCDSENATIKRLLRKASFKSSSSAYEIGKNQTGEDTLRRTIYEN